jgi:hypothetical protein
MNIKILIVPAVFLLAACSGSSDGTAGRGSVDTSPAIDSVFISGSDTLHQLNREDIAQLRGELVTNELTASLNYELNDLLRIDSLKTNKAYSGYLDSLEPGMTADARAFAAGEIDLGTNGKLTLWKVTSVSFEACPAFTGTLVLGTYEYSQKKKLMLLGKYFSVSDPPASGEDRITSKITGNRIDVSSVSISDEDTDVEGQEISKAELHYELKEGEVVILSADKKIP